MLRVSSLSCLATLVLGATLLGAVARADNLPIARAGEVIYNQTCVACHGKTGQGEIPGMPDFSRMDGTLSQSDDVLMKHLLNGFQSESSPMAMPPKGGNDDLTITDLRNVLQFMHQKFHYKTYK